MVFDPRFLAHAPLSTFSQNKMLRAALGALRGETCILDCNGDPVEETFDSAIDAITWEDPILWSDSTVTWESTSEGARLIARYPEPRALKTMIVNNSDKTIAIFEEAAHIANVKAKTSKLMPLTGQGLIEIDVPDNSSGEVTVTTWLSCDCGFNETPYIAPGEEPEPIGGFLL